MSKNEEKVILTAKDKTKAILNKFESRINKMAGAMFNFKNIAIAAASSAGIGALVKSSLDAGDKVHKLSVRLGASTEALSQYRHVAKLTGVTFETMTTSWQRQTRRIAEAVQGTGEAKNALRELGVDVDRLNKLKPEQQFERLADAFEQVDNQSDKIRLAMKIWDTEGVSMLQTIDGGSASLREMRAEADKLGLTLSSKQAKSMAAANDAITKLKASFSSLGNELAINLGPVITDIANLLRAGLPDGIAWTKKAILAAKSAFFDFSGWLSELSADVSTFLQNVFSMGGKFENAASKHFGEAAKKHMKDAFDSYSASADAYGKQLEIVIGQQEKFNASTGQGLAPVPTGDFTPTGAGDDSLNRLEKQMLGEEERIHQSYLRRNEMINSAFTGQLEMSDRHQDLLLANAEKYEKELTDLTIREAEKRRQAEERVTRAKIALAQSFSDSAYIIAQAAGKKYFKWAQRLDAAVTLIKAYQLATSAAAETPGGIWAKAAAYGSALAMGLKAVAQIRSTYIGSSGGGGVGGVSVPQNQPPPPPQSQQQQQPPQQLIQPIIIAGGGQDIDQVWDYLRERINRRDGVLVDKDSRQGQVILKGIQ